MSLMTPRVSAVLGAAVFASAAGAQALYTVTDLGRVPGYTYSTSALGMNNLGQVVGLGHNGSMYRAFVWDAANGVQALPPVPTQETRSSTAVAINDLGEIVGYCGQSGGSNMVGWLYRPASGYTLLGTVPGYNGCIPAAINNNTEIVGMATGAGPLDPATNFYWSPATGMVNVVPGTTAEFYGISDAGVVCGGYRSGVAKGLMIWDLRAPGGPLETDLGMLPGTALSFAYGINEHAQVAGVSVEILTGGHRISHSVSAGPFLGIQELTVPHTVASGINERGEVVGWRPLSTNQDFYSWFYSPQTGVVPDLQAVVENPSVITRVSGARAINDSGQIIASGTNEALGPDAHRRALILTPLGPCPAQANCWANCDCSGAAPALNVADFACFLQKFASGDAYANCDGSAAAPTLNIADFSCFLTKYATGCP